MKFILTLFFGQILMFCCNAQHDDSLFDFTDTYLNEYKIDSERFSSLQICNLQSTLLVPKGEFHFNVAHRFGYLNGGIKYFFGIDQANAKIQFFYGLSDRIQLSLSRDSYDKTYSGTSKIFLKKLSKKIRLKTALHFSADVNTLLSKNQYPGLRFFDRFAYSSQLILSKTFFEKISVVLSPIYVRQNLININYTSTPISPEGGGLPFNQYLISVGSKCQISNKIFLTFDYAYNFVKNKNSLYRNPLSLGMDIETFGHIFKLMFTNARAMNDATMLTETLGDWTKGDVSFGFSVVRRF